MQNKKLDKSLLPQPFQKPIGWKKAQLQINTSSANNPFSTQQ